MFYITVLQFYVSKGLIVRAIHRGLHFHQSKFIKPYIEFNSKMRAKATNSFDVDFFKLLSNSLFGKTIKQEDKRSKLKLVSDPNDFKKLSSRPTFASSKMIYEGLVSVTMKCPVLKLDKPSYIGYAILDLSRLFMSHSHYDVMLKKFSNSRVHLLYTNTDSLFYEIQSDDMYEELCEHANDFFDFSNYSPSHPNFNDQEGSWQVQR